MNTGMFTGNIGRDAELRRAQNGDAVANFPMAIEVGTKANPKTMWIDCSLWGKRAESVSPYLLKGKKVAVIGRVSQDEYIKRDGTHGTRIQVSCNEVELLGGGREQNDQSHEKHQTPKMQNVASAQQFDDDTPF